MKILLIHNKYTKYGGEDAVVEGQIALLKDKGHDVISYFRDSGDINNMFLGKLRVLFTALYNFRSVSEIKNLLKEEKPDIVHIHNLFPLVSPAILPVIKKMGIPIVMTVHNYRLICPNGLFFSNEKICEECAKGSELSCVRNNCEKSLFKSLGYALRNWFARKKKYYLNNVDVFACLTDFQKNKLVEYSFPKDKIVVIPNMYDKPISDIFSKNEDGDYIAFAGRISPEKGISVLLDAARLLPNICFKLAGGEVEGYRDSLDVPSNVEFVGMLSKDELKCFYEKAFLYVLSSVWYEGFPMVFPEAMNDRLPIIAPRLAGFGEVVEDEYNGLLFEVGNSEDLAKKIKFLYDNPELANQYGKAGFEKMKRLYSKEAYTKNLLSLYNSILD